MAEDQSRLEQDALRFHSRGRRGKIEIAPTKPLTTARDLSLAYSPGVAYPCLHIAKDPALAYDYTAKGNFVAVISNGTAVLGLGNIGAMAAKPVMEGKSVLFKRFADIDGIDLEVDTEDVDEFVACVKAIASDQADSRNHTSRCSETITCASSSRSSPKRSPRPGMRSISVVAMLPRRWRCAKSAALPAAAAKATAIAHQTSPPNDDARIIEP